MGRPLVQVGHVHLPVGVDVVMADFDHHVGGGLDEAYWAVVGVGLCHPHRHRDVVGVA